MIIKDFDTYREISDIGLLTNINNVISNCDKGLNMLVINTYEDMQYVIILYVDDVVTIRGFGCSRLYHFKVTMECKDDTLIANVIVKLLEVIQDNPDKVEIVD